MSAIFVRLMTILALAWVMGGTASSAQLAGPSRIASRLVAETPTPAPGSEVMLALVMRPREGWHGYWQNPGDAGAGMEVDWRLPVGARAGALRYPVPERLRISGLMNYVYKHAYALLVPLRVPPDLAPGTRLPISAGLRYLACTDKICVPETAEVALDLTVGAPRASPPRNGRFDAYRQALPRPLGREGRFSVTGDRLRLAVPVPASLALRDVYFFPLSPDALSHAAPQQVSRAGNSLVIDTRPAAENARPAAIDGVLAIGEGEGLSVVLRPGAVPAAGTPFLASDRRATASGAMLASALLGALVGGLLLNILPCVFPILSLKALSLARAGGDEATARREALAYAAGVILTCLALGGVLLALRAGGEAAGWAFQLQDPRVILFLFLLVGAITLNLAGVFELPAITGGERLATRGGVIGAFWTGVLAAFIATPCTGPFMGAALGAALVLPGVAALAVFAGLGLGLALPFLVLGFVPILRRRLPRPGPWMARFRHWMAVPMALTAAGLAWILVRQVGTTGLVVAFAAALVVGAALWAAGRRQSRRGAWLPLAPAGAAMLAALIVLPVAPAPASADAAALPGAQQFSENRLAALRAEGRPVFLYFTADWCLTCKVNEQAVLERHEVAQAFAGAKVAVLVGDWTRGDGEISRFLERHGRSGVPFYLYYPPGAEPEVLPQLLTVAILTRLVA